MAIPGVRAGLLDLFEIGAIRIRLSPPTSTPLPTLESQGEAPSVTSSRTTVRPSPTLPGLLDNLAGEMSLSEAREAAGFEIRLPSYPPDLGDPDYVYVQELEGAAVILLWMEPESPNEVRLALHQLASPLWAEKHATSIEETQVNGQPAVWVAGPHFIEVRNRQGAREWREARLVEGNVLIWQAHNLTYRLETKLPMEEAVRIAESVGDE
jgi:hypothetical protein